MVRLELGAAEDLDVDDGHAPQQRGADHQQRAGVERLDARPQDDQRAEEAAQDRRPAPPAEHLAEKQGAEQRREQRRREGQRGRPRQRRQRQADEERQHRHDVEHGAQHMQAEPLGVEQARPMAHQQGQDHHQAADVAEEGDLHRRQVLGRVADRRVHGREHDGAEHHQEAGTGNRRQAAISAQQGGCARERQEGTHRAHAYALCRCATTSPAVWQLFATGRLVISPGPHRPVFNTPAAPALWARSAASAARRRSSSRCRARRQSRRRCAPGSG